jgi:hypothetical protein
MHFVIPKELSHLKVDERGYPIPYFVPWQDGKPNFRFTDMEKIIDCVEHNRCGVCGRKLYKDFSYVISGIIGMGNRVSSDPAMHRVCAEFALASCPHMYFQKAERKETEGGVKYQPNIILNKPVELMLVKCKSKFKWRKKDECIFGYTYISHEPYHYVNGKLQKHESINNR